MLDLPSILLYQLPQQLGGPFLSSYSVEAAVFEFEAAIGQSGM